MKLYIICFFPNRYVILFILIGRGVTLPGAYDGIMFYLTPDFNKIKEPSVWFAAANQLFFSLSCSWGGMIALSSYNRFGNNSNDFQICLCYLIHFSVAAFRDALITVIVDSLTSFSAGFAIFSVIGYGAHLLQKPIDQVATAGSGLAVSVFF